MDKIETPENVSNERWLEAHFVLPDQAIDDPDNYCPTAIANHPAPELRNRRNDYCANPLTASGLQDNIDSRAASAEMPDASRQYQETVRKDSGGKVDLALQAWSNAQDGAPAKLLCEMHQVNAAAAKRLSRAVTSLPAVGEQFLGFHLVAVLGKGAFGQVYLAQQGDLANRPVALKVAADIYGESQTLAQLQHTNIVPVYSVHRADPFQAVCMPYFGATTLADILFQLGGGDSLPDSGKMLVSTVNDCRAATRRSIDSYSSRREGGISYGGGGEAIPPSSDPAAGADTALALRTFEGMTYTNAVLWMFSRLADGLAHSHDRGILHRDLKPANILLTDDGQPMLLDFNLSEDTKHRSSAAAASIGGTLPYMAPEHLLAFHGEKIELDARIDLYSLGVIFYELLTGRSPFPKYREFSANTLQQMFDDRVAGVPTVRGYNAKVSPAVEAIVQHCLEPDPTKRYQNAHEIHEDLERQLQNRVLKYVREASLSERLIKWSRRHPRLASSTTIATTLGTLLILLSFGIVHRDRKLAQFEADETYKVFQDESETAQFKLRSRHADLDQLEDGIERGRAALGYYQVIVHSQWRQLPAVHNLSRDKRERLDADAGELLMLMAKATMLQAQYYTPKSSIEEKLQEAQHLNLLAEDCFGQGKSPRALLDQRADLAKFLGDADGAQKYAALSKLTTADSAKDRYLIAHKQTIEGKYREALEALKQTTLHDPRNFSAWFVRGNCHYELLQDVHAIACFNSCVVLRPEFHWSWFNRGLANLRLRNYREACDDFNEVLRLQPNLADAYIHRAKAKQGLRRFQEAIEDYTKALEGEKVSTRVYFLRAEARALSGDQVGAGDFDKGLALGTD